MTDVPQLTRLTALLQYINGTPILVNFSGHHCPLHRQVMRLAATISLSIALLLSSVSALSIRDSCGPDPLVLSQKTFQFENQEIKVVTTSCPGFAALRNITRTSTLSSVRKRAVTQCGTTCRFMSCLASYIDLSHRCIDYM